MLTYFQIVIFVVAFFFFFFGGTKNADLLKALCYLSGTVLTFIDVQPATETAITICMC